MKKYLLMASLTALSPTLMAADVCEGFGPQTPRDIDSHAGTNNRIFALADDYQNMNLCNIHFHVNAEHKASDFAILAKTSDGQPNGYQCSMSQNLSKAELKTPAKNMCQGVKPGDTIEMHWVHSSCDVSPGEGLGSCLSESCANPTLRVETQVFTLVNDSNALSFDELRYGGALQSDDYHQAKNIPNNTGTPVVFAGSTTGPSYTEQSCSPLQVTWSVRPQCAKLDINSLSDWCENNPFNESKAHGVRELVTNPALLSEISSQ
ncbi:delta-class carbonic anhydrase [Marinicella sediminis]|uniref:Delta-class carbonic anhydrase n=1 Tax=Marinicella sediminis TaxID=1792834 RepID=A0ABV7J809_9GAMM|nr:delta-class carbonic anhydrase [Marinicella sediminis]